MTQTTTHTLPREIADGVFWLGACVDYPYEDELYHAYSSAFLVQGEECSLMVEAGHPEDLDQLEQGFDEILTGGPPLRYLFVSHQETPHAGGLGRWLAKYPDAVVVGDVSDYHLVFPEFADRLQPMAPGESIDLGGTEFRLVEAVFRDYRNTIWGFDTARRVLFPSDGFSYCHYHMSDQCGSLAEEVPELDFTAMTKMFVENVFYWTLFVDIEPYIERMDELVRRELDARVIAPTHGLPIGDIETILPKVWTGLRIGAASAVYPTS